jgi:hypothetical protein
MNAGYCILLSIIALFKVILLPKVTELARCKLKFKTSEHVYSLMIWSSGICTHIKRRSSHKVMAQPYATYLKSLNQDADATSALLEANVL